MREDNDQGAASGAAKAAAGDQLHALALIEATGFADLRRLIGAGRADLLVLDIAERIAAALPEASVAAVGRNLIELTLVATDRAALDLDVARLHAAFEQPLAIDGGAHRVRLAVGVATSCGAPADEIRLIEAAERALEEARRAPPKRAYAAIELAPANDDGSVGEELRRATKRDELFLQYQPKLHLRRQEITSIEALIRWRHPGRGLVLPNDFIPAAERSGAIGPVTLWTLQQVIADQRVLMRNGHDLPVFINIAGALLADARFIESAVALVTQSGAKIGFEITETSVIREPERAIRHLQRLAEIGVVITIDDYGAGLSSLAYLKQLPASELKIDKLFVTQLSSSHRDPLIVRSTIDLAHALEMEVVAEGVESPKSLALLAVMGCDMVQGFLISRPLALEALLIYLREEGHRGLVESARSPLERLTAVRARA